MVGERVGGFVRTRVDVAKQNVNAIVDSIMNKGSVGNIVGAFSPIPITPLGEEMAGRRATARRQLIGGMGSGVRT